MKIFLEIFGLFLVLCSLLPYIKTQLWWIRVLDFPRAQVAFFLALTAVLYLFFIGVHSTWSIVFLVLLGIGFINEIVHIIPFTFLYPVQALRSELKNPKNAFSFMISNVRMVNTQYDKFIDIVKEVNPDLLLINEPDQRWHDAIAPTLDPLYPYAIRKPLSNTYGMILFSKLKLHESKVNFLVEDEIPSFYTVVEMPSGKKFCLFTVHPQPPRFAKDTDTREAELLIVAKMTRSTPHAAIVAGDLNDVAWSHTTNLFKRISGMLDPRIGRGFYNTYSAYVPFFRYPLDHIFYDPSFRLIRMQRLHAFGSDHFPILVELSYEPQEADEHEVPQADHEDHQEAKELIDDGLKKAQEEDT